MNPNIAQVAKARSPRQAGVEKAAQALTWIYRWGWSSSKIIGLVAKDNFNGLAARLERTGYLKKTKTEAGGGVKDIPVFMFTLTPKGVAEVERHLTSEAELLQYNINPLRIRQALLRHDHIAQYITIRNILKSNIDGYLTQRELLAKSELNVKQPDVIWLKDGKQIGVEVELSGKWKRDLDNFVRSCVTALSTERFSHIFLFSDSAAVLERYKKAFKAGATIGIWERDETRHWHKVGSETVPPSAETKILCQKIDYS